MKIELERPVNRRPATWLTLLGVLLIPVLIAGGFTAATWKASDRLQRVQAAVVNLDDGTELEGQFVPLGRQLAAGLVTEEDSNFTWVLADEADAEEGLRTGRYVAVVTIPQDFSRDATSFADTDNARKAVIDVETSRVTGVADAAIGQQIADVAAARAGRTLTEGYLDQIYLGFNDSGKQFRRVSDGANDLAKGAAGLTKGVGQAGDGVGDLADGMDQLSTGGDQLATGSAQLATGTRGLADGLGAAAPGARELADGLVPLADGAGKSGSAARELARGNYQLADGLDQAAAGAAPLADGAAGLDRAGTQLADGSRQLGTAARQIAPGAAGLADGVDAYTRGVDQVNNGVQPILKGLGDLDQLPSPDELDRFGASSKRFRSAASGVWDGLRNYRGFLGELGAEDQSIIACPYAGESDSKRLCAAFDAGRVASAQAARGALNASNGEGSLLEGAEGVADGAEQMDSGVQELVRELKPLAEQASALAENAPRLAEASANLAQSGAALRSGSAELSDGLAALGPQLDQLATGVGGVGAGAKALAAGAGQLAGGIAPAASGARQLGDGAGQLAGGLDQLAGGADAAAGGADQLATGIETAATGAGELATGSEQFATGTAQYAGGVRQAADGTRLAADGMRELKNGSDQLSDGTTRLADGLAQGADELPNYSTQDRVQLKAAAAQPVIADATNAALLPEATATSLLMVLALWLGALAAFIALSAVPSTVLTSRTSSARLALQTLAPGVAIAVIQALALSVVGEIVLGLSFGKLVAVFALLALMGAAFVAVNHALVAWFGGVGRVLSVAMIVITAASAIVSAVPGWFDALLPLSPLTPALQGIRAVITDGPGVSDGVIGCLLWLIVGVAASIAAIARRRSADPRGILVQAPA